METPVMSLFSKVVSFGFLASTLVTDSLEKSMNIRKSRPRRKVRALAREIRDVRLAAPSRALRAARSALVALLMLGMCAIGHTAPRIVHHKSAPHSDTTLLDTTLPVPEVTGAATGRHEPGRHGTSGSPVLAYAAASDRAAPDRVGGPERANGQGANDEGAKGERGGDANGAFPIHWRESREIVGPEIVSRIRNYHRDGLPVVQLWESQQSRVSIGVSPRGMPGIYFTRHVGG